MEGQGYALEDLWNDSGSSYPGLLRMEPLLIAPAQLRASDPGDTWN